ncbi:MAG: hypothetical protein KDK54_21585 [Leptospiraceae bacterium]|nr:hypothetical protein [Leptospiraceae bacterium]
MALSDDGMSSVEDVGFGEQIGDSFKSILAGIGMLPLSIFMIFKVETCTQASEAFKHAVPVTEKQEGKPIYVTGKLTASPIGNSFIRQGSYISVSVSSEVYAWDEETKTEGSGSNKKKRKTCKLEWTSNPDNPSSFTLEECKKKIAYKIPVKAETIYATNGKLTQDGTAYGVDLSKVSYTSDVKSETPTSDQIISNGYIPDGNYLYNRSDCDTNPTEGCQRIKLSTRPIPSEDMTFLGDLKSGNIDFYEYDDSKFLSASPGDFKEAMKDIKSDDSTMKWIGRILCFLVMWASFVMMAGPMTTLLEYIPFVGDFGSGIIKFVLGALAFVITFVTIVLVKFWYIWLLILIGSIGFAIYTRKNQQAQGNS